MKYVVMDNNRKAQFPEIKVDPSWNQAAHNSFDEALAYAKKWTAQDDLSLKLNEPLDYSGFGDIIVICTEYTKDDIEVAYNKGYHDGIIRAREAALNPNRSVDTTGMVFVKF